MCNFKESQRTLNRLDKILGTQVQTVQKINFKVFKTTATHIRELFIV